MTTIAIFVAVFLLLVAVTAFWIWAVDQVWRRVLAWHRRRALEAFLREGPFYTSPITHITAYAPDRPDACADGVDPRR